MSDGGSGVLSDIIKDLRGAWSSRISNPIMGAFALSWLVVNYRALVVVLSGSSFKEKFAYIDAVLYPNELIIGLKCIGIPLVLAILYIYVLPIPTEGVYRWTLDRQRRLNKIAREVAGEQLLSVDQSREFLEQVKLAEDVATRASREADLAKEQYLQEASARDAERAAERTREQQAHQETLERAHVALQEESSRSADLAWKLTYERAMSVGYAAMEMAERRLRAFLMARQFMAVASGQEFGNVRFHRNGSITHSDSENLKEWKRWDLKMDKSLVVLDEDGRQVAEFNWDPGQRMWAGYIDSRSGSLRIEQPVE